MWWRTLRSTRALDLLIVSALWRNSFRLLMREYLVHQVILFMFCDTEIHSVTHPRSVRTIDLIWLLEAKKQRKNSTTGTSSLPLNFWRCKADNCRQRRSSRQPDLTTMLAILPIGPKRWEVKPLSTRAVSSTGSWSSRTVMPATPMTCIKLFSRSALQWMSEWTNQWCMYQFSSNWVN